MGMQGWPCRHMDFLALNHGVIFEQRLDMLPARERADFADGEVDDIQQTAPGCFAKDSALHMCGLDLAPPHDDRARRIDGALADIQRVAIALGESKDDRDSVLGGNPANSAHVVGIIGQRVLEIGLEQTRVDGTAPAEISHIVDQPPIIRTISMRDSLESSIPER